MEFITKLYRRIYKSRKEIELGVTVKRRIMSAVIVCVFVGTSGCIFPSESPEEAVSDQPHVAMNPATWLQQNVIPFDTVEPGGGFDDLMPLKDVIGNARIVALGEATHGTAEFFTMKHRMLEFLVEEMGFNTFVIEAPWCESRLIDHYIHTGEGNPAELLAGLHFWTWNTQEVLDMIEWMQDHNENPGTAPRVSFFGYDIKYPSPAMDDVVAYLQKVDPEAAEYIDSLYAPFHEQIDEYKNQYNYQNQPQSVKDQCRENVKEAYDFLKNNQSRFGAASSPEEISFTLQTARICVQAEDFYAGEGERDQYMAENIMWLPDYLGLNSKMVIWAHNAHVGVSTLVEGTTSEESMGFYLREEYGDDMVIFGFTFYSGSLHALTVNESGQYGTMAVHKVEPPPEESCEYYFHSAGIPYFFLDLRDIIPGPATDWLFQPLLYRYVGSGYQPANPEAEFEDAVLPDMFDVMVYFEDTTPSHLLGHEAESAPSRSEKLKMPPSITPADMYMTPGNLLHPNNLGFEAGLLDWERSGISRQDYEVGTDTTIVYSGEKSGYIKSITTEPSGFGTLVQVFKTDEYRGKRLRMSAYMKTEGVTRVGLWMRVDGPYNGISIDAMFDRPVSGDTDWTRYDLVLDVTDNSIRIAFGVVIIGTGHVWVDDFQFEVVGDDVPVTGIPLDSTTFLYKVHGQYSLIMMPSSRLKEMNRTLFFVSIFTRNFLL